MNSPVKQSSKCPKDMHTRFELTVRSCKEFCLFVPDERGLFLHSPFHSSLPFEHLVQSNSFTRVCHLFVNQAAFYSILELKQCPRCQLLFKSIQHFSLGNDVTSSDKNIVIAWLKHIFISKFFSQHIQCILRTHICNRRDKSRILYI